MSAADDDVESLTIKLWDAGANTKDIAALIKAVEHRSAEKLRQMGDEDAEWYAEQLDPFSQ